VIYALIALLVGLGVASATNGLLALSVDTKQIPQEVVVPVSAPTQPAEPPDIATIAMPKGYADDPLLAMAVERFQDALATVGERPKIVSGSADFVVRQKDLPAQGFQMWAEGVNGAGRQGMANGLLAAADSVAAGQELPASPGAPVVPQLEYRFADYGAVGVRPDPAAWAQQEDYSHNSRQFADVVLSEEPWVDPAGLAEVTREWQDYIDHIRAYGYNGVIVSGFLEYVNFDKVGDGYQIYPEDSPYRARHEAMVEQFGAMWKYADEMGMQVVFKTDMLANTGPLNDYVERELGGFDVDDPRLWELYQAGLEEFFENMPFVDGLMIRIGEAGTVYNSPGWDYFSRSR